MRENTDQKNSEYGHFLRSDRLKIKIKDQKFLEEDLRNLISYNGMLHHKVTTKTIIFNLL